MEEIALARLDRVESGRREHLAQDDQPGDDHRRAVGLEPGTRRRASSEKRGQPGELGIERPARTGWPWTSSGSYSPSPRSRVASVVTVPATPIARAAPQVGAARPARALAPTVGRSLPRTLGHPHAADIEAQCRATPSGPPSTSSVEPPPTSTTSVSGSRSRPVATPRKVSSASSSPVEQARREAVAPFDLGEERLAVLRVADGARRDGERRLRAGIARRLGGSR